MAKLKSIKINTEIKPLYDIEVQDNHNFVANGIFVHNSEQYLEFMKGQSAGLCVLMSYNYMYLYRKFGSDVKAACEFLSTQAAPSCNRFIDNIVSKEIEDKRYATKEQLNSLKSLRRVGVGITNLDGYLIYNSIGYDTDEGIETIYRLTDALNYGLYKSSIELGKEKGSFEAFKKELYTQSPFVKQMIKRHKLEFDAMRNVCVFSIAPTGCCVKETKVLTSEGYKTIESIFTENGIDISKLEKENVKNEWFVPKKDIYVKDVNNEDRKITKLYCNGADNTKKITFEDGTIFQATYEHKVLVVDEENPEYGIWKKLEDLNENDKIIEI